MTKLNDQIGHIKAIFAGSYIDNDGFRGCPGCGSRNFWHFGQQVFDSGILRCIDCGYSLSGGTERELMWEWNTINRSCFQLELPFEHF